MAKSELIKNGKTKDNSRKSGAAAMRKERLRREAEERNAAYQALSFEEKMERNSTKVQKKLQKEKANEARND